MATYIWTGAVNTTLTEPGNWTNGYPVGASDTKVIIGHTPFYPNHTISNWPAGGHLDMQIGRLYVNPGYPSNTIGSGDNQEDIRIGSSSNPLKISETRLCVFGGFEHSPLWENCPTADNSITYIRMEDNDAGPLTKFELYGYTSTSEPSAPTAELTISGNPYHFYATKAKGFDVTWTSSANNIAGDAASLAENGPQKIGFEDQGFPGWGFGFENCLITLDWQREAAGGNPIKDAHLDARACKVTIVADSWEEGDTTCLSGWGTAEGSYQLDEELATVYYIKSTAALGQESNPISIPTLNLLGTGLIGSTGENVNKAYIQSGVTVGGQSTGTGLNTRYFDITFTDDAATNTTIKSGTLYWRTRIDAGDLSAGSFKMVNESSGEGVQIVRRSEVFGGGLMGTVRIKPPHNANIRVR